MEKTVKDRFEELERAVENVDKKVLNIDEKFNMLIETLIKTNRTSLCEIRKKEHEQVKENVNILIDRVISLDRKIEKLSTIKNRRLCISLGKNRQKN